MKTDTIPHAEARRPHDAATRPYRHALVTTVCLGLILFSAGLLSGCKESEREQPPVSPSAPRIETVSREGVDLTFTIDPPTIQYERDTLLSIEVSGPAALRIGLPNLQDRLQGFILNGTFEDPAVTEGERITRRINARLTPLPKEEHRIAPMPILVNDTRTTPPSQSWFPTPPIVLDVTAPTDTDPGSGIRDAMDPVWIRPPFREVAAYALGLLALIGIGFLLWKLAGRLHRQVQLMRMSPRERALKELAMLLAKDLIAGHKVKEFYIQLTMIVRRYIERAHKVRAPEQTTEEFLSAVKDDPQFSRDVVNRLEAFLQAADLVKFAAYHPDAADIDHATATARSYIEQDAAETEEKDCEA